MYCRIILPRSQNISAVRYPPRALKRKRPETTPYQITKMLLRGNYIILYYSTFLSNIYHNKQNYSSDEQEEKGPKLPLWAQKDQLSVSLHCQFPLTNATDPVPTIFPEFTPTIDLDRIFQPKDEKTKSKYARRNSSSVWHHHQVTEDDIDNYNRAMGYTQ